MKLDQKPMIGILAFIIVLFTMPLGHAFMILIQVILGKTYQYVGAIFGDRRPFTYFIFFGSLLWSLYLIIRLVKYAKIAPAMRYTIPTVVIFWNSVEILGRWDFFKEIWVEPTQYALEMGL